MECNEGSKSFVEVDGIRHSFDNSMFQVPMGLVQKPQLAFLHMFHEVTLIPNLKMIMNSLSYMLLVIRRGTTMTSDQVDHQSRFHNWVKLAFPHFPVFSIGPLRPLLQELYLQLHKHPLQQKLGNLPPQVTLSPVWICWR